MGFFESVFNCRLSSPKYIDIILELGLSMLAMTSPGTHPELARYRALVSGIFDR